MPKPLARVAMEAVAPPAVPGDLVGWVPVDAHRTGQRVIAVLPGGRAVAGALMLVGRVWWLWADDQELIALAPGIELFRLLLFRPL